MQWTDAGGCLNTATIATSFVALCWINQRTGGGLPRLLGAHSQKMVVPAKLERPSNWINSTYIMHVRNGFRPPRVHAAGQKKGANHTHVPSCVRRSSWTCLQCRRGRGIRRESPSWLSSTLDSNHQSEPSASSLLGVVWIRASENTTTRAHTLVYFHTSSFINRNMSFFITAARACHNVRNLRFSN